MAVKRYFDGSKLIETEIPDAPLPSVLNVRGRSALDVVAPENPTGVNPDNLLVNAAELPDLVPTAGAQPVTKFPDPLPGSGEGPGVGQPSGLTLRDAWANNPAQDPGTVKTLQSGPVGSLLPPAAAAAAQVTNERRAAAQRAGLPTSDPFEDLANSWSNKAAVREWIEANASEDYEQPHVNATRDELIDAARGVYRDKDAKLAADLA